MGEITVDDGGLGENVLADTVWSVTVNNEHGSFLHWSLWKTREDAIAHAHSETFFNEREGLRGSVHVEQEIVHTQSADSDFSPKGNKP